MITLPLANGVAWQFRERGRPGWRTAEVPGCVHRDLRRHRLIPDPFWGRNEHEVQWVSERTWEYRTRFELGDAMLKEQGVDLVADGLDTLATVWVNGVRIGASDNMFAGWRWPVRRHLRPGMNDILVRFAGASRWLRTHRTEHVPREINDPVGGGTRVRKQQCQFGWDWAPRLDTVGIWRGMRFEAWTHNRIESVRIRQWHDRKQVRLELEPETARPDAAAQYRVLISRNGRAVVSADGLAVTLEQPELWWPAGHGAQPLYEIVVELWSQGRQLDSWTRRIGLRTVELELGRDPWGESFRFVVNGRSIFAKGASWIPAHSLVGGLGRADYEPLLRSAAAAHMNMLRVWGGGIYEHECFYDLCDELGLMVWQDFMFACTLYPGDRSFRASVKREADYQVRRLRHRACLALWCGNNELELLNGADLKKPAQRKAYDAVFRKILPDSVGRWDGVTPYWRSTPSQSDAADLADPSRSGCCHFWDVWHLLKPVKSYEQSVYRFVSEFGMQSFPSEKVARTFCPPEELNVFSPVMENHQKNPMGNRIILEYVGRRYRFPKDYPSLAYLSQLNQAYCMQVGVEHYRRHQPRCMGTLYWQLNDCWPVASWSSLEFGGGWKALHHAARRFYAPLLLSAHVPGDEIAGIGNRMRSTVREVFLHTVCDAPAPAAGRIEWELRRVDGRILWRGRKNVRLRPGESRKQVALDLAPEIREFGREKIYLRIALRHQGRMTSEETVFLCPPRLLDLTKAKTDISFRPQGPNRWAMRLSSPVFQHRVAIAVDGVGPADFSDNWFDLHPGRTKVIILTLTRKLSAATLRRALTVRSLVDSYL